MSGRFPSSWRPWRSPSGSALPCRRTWPSLRTVAEHAAQLARPRFVAHLPDIPAGLALLAIGLVKKIVIAGNVSVPASRVFDGAANGIVPSFGDAWVGAIAYALELYFDFSGYSDMAIGVAWMLGIRLPFNFASPYKARSLVDF